MSWIRGTSSDFVVLSNDVVEAATEESLDTVDSIGAGGSGYSVGDILTLSGGTSTVAAQVEVTTVGTDDVTGVRRYNDGVYTVTPGDPVSTTGTGTGCTLNVSWVQNGWTVNRDTTYTGSDREVIMNGPGGGSDEIFVGWRTFRDVPGDYYNWELHGFTGYVGANDFDEQPGISPGFFDGATSALKAGSYFTLANASIQYWLSITGYRIILICKIGSNYFNAYLGWGNRFAVSTEYPYPLIVSGNSSFPAATNGQSTLQSGLVDPWRSTDVTGNTTGPMHIIDSTSVWWGVANGAVSGSNKTHLGDRVVVPTGRPDGVDDGGLDPANKWADEINDFGDIIPETGLATTQTSNLRPTPNTGDFYALLPTIIVFTDPAPQVMAEIDDCYWVSAFGGVVSEDRHIVSGEVYRIFQNCNRTDTYAFWAVREG